jgi:hypothetical protein
MTHTDPAVALIHKQPTSKELAIEYLGFRNAEDRREYRLRARQGADVRQFTVSIAHAAFAAGHALLQDGPDICYRKLWSLLLGDEPIASTNVEINEGELKEYRAARAPAPRGSGGSRPAQQAPSPWRLDGRPTPRDRG